MPRHYRHCSQKEATRITANESPGMADDAQAMQADNCYSAVLHKLLVLSWIAADSTMSEDVT